MIRERLASLDLDAATVTARLSTRYDEVAGEFGDRIVLYGAGKLGRETAAGLRAVGTEPLAFVDSNPLRWGGELDGIAIVSPAEAAARWGEDATFVVAVSQGTELRRELANEGCRTVVPYTYLWWKYARTFLPLHGICRPDSTLAHADEIRQVAALWADEASRVAYAAQIEWRLSLDYGVLPTPTPADQTYFIPEIALRGDETFVDVGAYDGDTLMDFFARVPEGQAIALEPDPKNWEALVRNAAVYGDAVELHQVAASSLRGELSFHADGTLGASAATDGEIKVRAERLDDLLTDEQPTFLKFDIEGAELDALKGAAETIRRCRPVLAVCLYHKPEDLWEIPLFVQSLGVDYRLLFRAHAEECWETVLYAVPADRYLP